MTHKAHETHAHETKAHEKEPTFQTKVRIIKKSAMPKQAHAIGKAAAAPGSFVLLDNEDDTFTTLGVDAAGNFVDISAVATEVVSVDDETVLKVDPPVGMTSAMHTVNGDDGKPKLGTANITATVTWNDGSIGPFGYVLPVSVEAGPVTGVVIVPGTPTPRS